MSTELLVFNGIDGASGEYVLPPMTPAQVSALAQNQVLEPEELSQLQQRKFDLQNPHAGVEADARELSQTGWGVIFAYDADPAIREALSPLLELRKSQAGSVYKEFTGADGYRPGEAKSEFLERHGMGPGPADPMKVPYYLLIVGDPATIPYRFQYQLDVQYAVGRIHFDTLDEYAAYAQSVVTAEKGFSLPPKAAFFGVENQDDRATGLSAEYLVSPLAQYILEQQPKWIENLHKSREAAGLGDLPAWDIKKILKDDATKACLSDLLNGSQAPALLFSASHGMSFPNGDARQIPQQGALLCQDWPGPQLWRGAIPQDFYFAGDDLTSDANLLGTIGFFFACYGAGTPQVDEFARQIWKDQADRTMIAPHDFIAGLPRRMLGLSKGGALAAVGHVERAWGVSFFWGDAGPQLQVFKDCMERLIKGNYPLGYALEVFNNRYAEISSDLSNELDEIKNFFKKPNDQKLANLWTANNDARNYVLLGDPAVRLAVAGEASATASRSAIEVLSRTDVEEKVPVPDGPVPVPYPNTDLGPTPEAVSTPQGPLPESGPALPPSIIPSPGVQQPSSPLAPSPQGAPVDYGLIDTFRQAQSSMSSALQGFVNKMGDFLSKALDDATSLEVSTYVSDNIAEVEYANGKFSGAKLRALTVIKIDGDTLLCVPEENGEVDTSLWKVHMEMLEQAQASRAELLKAVVSAATGLVDLIKPGA